MHGPGPPELMTMGAAVIASTATTYIALTARRTPEDWHATGVR